MKHKFSKKIKNIFYGKKILITGGTGSIGSEIVRQLIPFSPSQIRIYSRDETKHFFLQQELKKNNTTVDIRYLIGDIRDAERLDKAMGEIDIVFHAAALKHVSFCEYNPFEAIKTNVYGTQNVINAAIKHNVRKVIGISTDKAVYPTTFMGITKLLMERMIINSIYYLGGATTKFCIVRFGNVIDSRGSVMPLWREQIKNGGPVTITDKHMKRFFMTIPSAVGLVFTAVSIMKGQEIFILKMKEKGIFGLAKKTIKENSKGKRVGIQIIGKHEREKLSERLFTDEEKDCLIEEKSFYIIPPQKTNFNNL